MGYIAAQLIADRESNQEWAKERQTSTDNAISADLKNHAAELRRNDLFCRSITLSASGASDFELQPVTIP
jgi:hypothetical protein